MFYNFMRRIVIFLIHLLNGKLKVLNKDKLPQGNYILVAPHRTWLDPLVLAMAASPKQFAFMAKKELFKNPILKFILTHSHAFPVDRENPGSSAIKIPVRWLRNTDMSLIMFPSGTRHSQALKGGALLIAKLAKVPIVPAVYQGPLTFKELVKRGQATVAIGDPIYVDPTTKLTSENQQKIITEMENAFKQLDDEINPKFVYVDPAKKGIPVDDSKI